MPYALFLKISTMNISHTFFNVIQLLAALIIQFSKYIY